MTCCLLFSVSLSLCLRVCVCPFRVLIWHRAAEVHKCDFFCLIKCSTDTEQIYSRSANLVHCRAETKRRFLTVKGKGKGKRGFV